MIELGNMTEAEIWIEKRERPDPPLDQ